MMAKKNRKKEKNNGVLNLILKCDKDLKHSDGKNKHGMIGNFQANRKWGFDDEKQ